MDGRAVVRGWWIWLSEPQGNRGRGLEGWAEGTVRYYAMRLQLIGGQPEHCEICEAGKGEADIQNANLNK